MNNFFLSYSAFFIVCFSSSSSEPAKFSDKQIIVKTVFKGSGHIILNYLNADFRGASLHIDITTLKDTVVYRSIIADRPVVFYHLKSAGRELLKSSFIAEPGDTLSLSVTGMDVSCETENSKSDALIRIYGTPSLFKTDKEYNGTNISQLVDSVERMHTVNRDKIHSIANKNQWSNRFLNVLLSYNRLLTFAGIFKINYEAINHKGNAAPLLNQYYRKLVAEKELLEEIYASEIKTILYYGILLSSWRNGKAGVNFYEQIHYIDTSLCRKEYTDGFLYDKMRNDENLSTIQKRREMLTLLKPIIKDESVFLRSSGFTIRSLGSNVLNTSLEGFDGKMVSFNETLGHKKKVTIIDFWASWCAPCLAEVPALKKIKSKYEAQVQVLSISIDENRQLWLAACKRYKLTSNSYLNVGDKESALVSFLRLSSIPRLIILNSKGEMIEDDFYRPSDNRFEFELNNILNTKLY